jgi:hypothetical protein
MLKSAANPVDIPYNLSFRESLALMRKRCGGLERELQYSFATLLGRQWVPLARQLCPVSIFHVNFFSALH